MRALGLLGQVELPAEVAAVPRMRRYVRDLLDDTEHPHTDHRSEHRPPPRAGSLRIATDPIRAAQ